MRARPEEKRGGTVFQEVKPMRTTRHQFHGQMHSRAPSKPCLRATFLLRFHRGMVWLANRQQFPEVDKSQ